MSFIKEKNIDVMFVNKMYEFRASSRYAPTVSKQDVNAGYELIIVGRGLIVE